ncbi:50S ribosomal protein L28 [candidate division WWE3 bacterium CG08_land_8_20_14_0_20_41_10]|uniref:50S ribosomal protein L28 n=1 Tax=candidate division WWE3 bacterium CG08_land_8_20_14_0_20_41_10 TaxID=1975085 RepID=A0A2H0XBB1_UNCKA|nr:MAG: 50S ribosomal protein L28 [candidate division WWE3 bacterium CG08_land_8_20_14_0_20_41_10]
MSRMCEICGKGRLRGKLVPRLIGRRVSRRSIHVQQVNLREKHLDLGGRIVKVKLCTTCLSLYNKSNKKPAESKVLL